ncbi:hypothetical protein AYI69_g11326, partial [Smittium culicis]
MNDSSSDSSVARTHPIVGANFESDTPYSNLPLNVPRSDLQLESVPKPDSNLESFATLAAVINQPLHHGKLQPELLPYNSVANAHYSKRVRVVSASRSTISPRVIAPRPTWESVIAKSNPASRIVPTPVSVIVSASTHPIVEESSQPVEIQIRALNHNVSKFIDDCATVSAPAKKKAYRLASMSFFLTYPKCTLSKETVLAELKKICDVETYIVARELHS